MLATSHPLMPLTTPTPGPKSSVNDVRASSESRDSISATIAELAIVVEGAREPAERARDILDFAVAHARPDVRKLPKSCVTLAVAYVETACAFQQVRLAT